MKDTPLRRTEEVQRLTQEYASYSQSRNGLGNVLGGVVGLIIVLLNGLVGPGFWTAVLTIGLTFGWLVGKEIIRHRVYLSLGMARELWSPRERKYHTWSVLFVALISIGVCVVFILLGGPTKPQGWLYLFFVALMPWISWRYLRTSNEFVVGVFLLCACAVTSAGGSYGLLGWWWVGLVALLMVYAGIVEHRRYGRLVAQLQAQRMVDE
ncbi:hypothetical protein [Dictyobacter halimunensis]